MMDFQAPKRLETQKNGTGNVMGISPRPATSEYVPSVMKFRSQLTTLHENN